jgi:uncharacterized membrane protein YfcA
VPAERSFDPRILIVGIAGGFVGGFFGVGGGIVLVPLILWVLKTERHVAHATSLAAIIVIAIAGMAGFAVEGQVNWVVGAGLATGGVLGAAYGANLMDRLSPRTLRNVFAVVLIVSGLRMVIG